MHHRVISMVWSIVRVKRRSTREATSNETCRHLPDFAGRETASMAMCTLVARFGFVANKPAHAFRLVSRTVASMSDKVMRWFR